MQATITRLPDMGKYERYEVQFGSAKGEVIALHEFARSAIDEILGDLDMFRRKQ